MKFKNVFIIVGIILILLGIGFMIHTLMNKDEGNTDISSLPKEVIVKQYEAGTDNLIKEVKINDVEKIKELSNYVSKLKPLEEHEMVNLALLQEIDIIYNDSISIGFQLDNEWYCYYKNTDENISSLSHMPKGLLDWAKDNLDIK